MILSYINNSSSSAEDYSIHAYADDTVLSVTGPSPDAVLTSLQDSFIQVQNALSSLNLPLDCQEGFVPSLAPHITTLNRTILEKVTDKV